MGSPAAQLALPWQAVGVTNSTTYLSIAASYLADEALAAQQLDQAARRKRCSRMGPGHGSLVQGLN